MKFIKDNAEKFHIDPDYVFVNGYSAGGHLAASLGTLYNSKYVTDAIDMPENYARPAGMVLAYPVITSDERHAHLGSFKNILHEDFGNMEKRLEVSMENCVSADTVPAFIWHTATDPWVPVQNSLLMSSALANNNVPFELHVYPDGPHGLSLATFVTGDVNDIAARWLSDSVRWMNSINV